MGKASRYAAAVVAAAVLLAALTVLHTWPLARQAGTHVYASDDTVSGVWSLFALVQQLLANPQRPLDGNNLYPYTDTLAVLDHQIGSAPVAVPLVAAGADVPLTYNLALLAGFVLTGVTTSLLVRYLTGSWLAGLFAGCSLAFCGARVQALHNPHLLVTAWMPAALLTLHRFVDRPDLVRGLALAMASAAVALSSWHIAVLGGATLALVSLLLLAQRSATWKAALGVVVAGAIAGAAALPLARTYLEVAEWWPPRTGGGRETVGTLLNHSTDLGGLVGMPPAARAPYASLLPPTSGVRPGVFPGFVTVAVALVAAWVHRRRRTTPAPAALRLARAGFAFAAVLAAGTVAAAAGGASTALGLLRALAPFVLLGVALLAHAAVAARHTDGPASPRVLVVVYATVAAIGALMALGPVVTLGNVDLGSGFNRLDLLPVRLIMRAPARFALLAAVGMAVLAGLGAAALLRHRSRPARWAIAAMLLAAINLDLSFATPPLTPVPAPSQADRWLQQSGGPGAVIEYPLRENYWAMLASQRNGREIVNGAGYLAPPELLRLEALPDFSPEQLDVLWTYQHPRYVIVRTGLYDVDQRAMVRAALAAQRGALAPRLRRGEDLVFELFDRGHGPVLQRVWPRRRLAESAGEFAIEGRITEGSSGTVGELAVELNGHRLLLVRGEEAQERGVWTASFGDHHLVEGLNTLELRAGYTRDPAGAAAVGATGATLAADLAVVAERAQATVEVNGRRFVAGSEELLLLALEEGTGAVLAHDRFRLTRDPQSSAAVTQFVRALKPRTIVVAAGWLAAGAMSASLRDLGMATPEAPAEVALAVVGVVGAAAGTAVQHLDAQAASLTFGLPERRRVQLTSLQLR